MLKGAVGLVQQDAQDQKSWTTMDRVAPGDLDDWKDEKRSGLGRDPRVLPLQRDSQGYKFF